MCRRQFLQWRRCNHRVRLGSILPRWISIAVTLPTRKLLYQLKHNCAVPTREVEQQQRPDFVELVHKLRCWNIRKCHRPNQHGRWLPVHLHSRHPRYCHWPDDGRHRLRLLSIGQLLHWRRKHHWLPRWIVQQQHQPCFGVFLHKVLGRHVRQ